MAEPQKSAEQKPSQPIIATTSDIAVVNLVNSAGFDSEAQTVIVGKNVEAAIETDRGVLIQRRVGSGTEKTVERYLLPWSNIKSVKYAAPTPPKA